LSTETLEEAHFEDRNETDKKVIFFLKSVSIDAKRVRNLGGLILMLKFSYSGSKYAQAI